MIVLTYYSQKPSNRKGWQLDLPTIFWRTGGWRIRSGVPDSFLIRFDIFSLQV